MQPIRSEEVLERWEQDESFSLCRLDESAKVVTRGEAGVIILLHRDDSEPAGETIVSVGKALDVGLAAASLSKLSANSRPSIAKYHPTHIAFRGLATSPGTLPEAIEEALQALVVELRRRFRPAVRL